MLACFPRYAVTIGLGVERNPDVDVDRAFVDGDVKVEYCIIRDGVETGDVAYAVVDEDSEKEEVGENAKGFCGCGLDYKIHYLKCPQDKT